MSLSEELRSRIDALIQDHQVVLFMKGDRSQPQCGFSNQVVQTLDGLLPEYKTVNVLADAEIRDGIKVYSDWPTIPQLYIDQEFIGGCDIIVEMAEKGELQKLLKIDLSSIPVPKILLSDKALETIQGALTQSEHPHLLLKISPQFEHSLGFTSEVEGLIEAQDKGISIYMDFISAARADGVSIDFIETPQGMNLVIENPNLPNPVQPLTPKELKAKIDAGEELKIYDVRTPEERKEAYIEGSILVDQRIATEIESHPKDGALVFYCQHGGRSQSAAEHFRSLGFENVHNLVGGMEAWQNEIQSA